MFRQELAQAARYPAPNIDFFIFIESGSGDSDVKQIAQRESRTTQSKLKQMQALETDKLKPSKDTSVCIDDRSSFTTVQRGFTYVTHYKV